MSTKQVIVWRNDLKCRAGKKMGQAAHATLANFVSTILANKDADGNVSFKLTPDQLDWYEGNFRKIVLKVESEQDLFVVYEKAKELGLPVEIITDSALTEWENPTRTCVSIGPCEESKIDAVTGDKGPLGRLSLM